MVMQILVNIGRINGLLPDGTKPLPEPMLTVSFCDIHLMPISLEILSLIWVQELLISDYIHIYQG